MDIYNFINSDVSGYLKGMINLEDIMHTRDMVVLEQLLKEKQKKMSLDRYWAGKKRG